MKDDRVGFVTWRQMVAVEPGSTAMTMTIPGEGSHSGNIADDDRSSRITLGRAGHAQVWRVAMRLAKAMMLSR